MYDQFRQTVEHIFNNWTALRLAVEHGMGGPDSKNEALNYVDELTAYCVNYDVDVEDIEDNLIDFLDLKFDTICEDNSVREIANILHRFLSLLQQNNLEQFSMEMNKLPTSGNTWLTVHVKPEEVLASSSVVSAVPENSNMENEDVAMDEDEDKDPGWTKVKTKRRH